MKLKILGSNSAGNCYVLDGERQSLLLECGVHPKLIKQAVDFDVSKIVGCLVTHEHLDHFKYVDDVASLGINIYGSPGTLQNKYGHRFFEVNPIDRFFVGEFEVKAFPVIHDARQPYGYIIRHPDCGSVLFLTDSSYSGFKFVGINHFVVEANHSLDLLQDKVLSGKMQHFVYDRLIKSHMSIETCQELILANNVSDIINIVLIHLSDANSKEEEFKKTIEAKTGKIVHIARPGKEISLLPAPF